MARVEITIPEKFHFSTELDIRVGDLNYGAHMANDSIASYANEVRVQLVRAMGFESELNIEGKSLIMADAATIFKNEGFHGDRIRVDVAVVEMGRSGFELIFVFENLTKQNRLAISKAGMLFFDYINRKPTSIPDSFRAWIEEKS